MKRLAATAVALLVSAVGAVTATTPAQGVTTLFSDDFTGAAGAYDHTKWEEWSSCTYNSSAAFGAIGCGDRAHLDGSGHLIIPATPAQGTAISTKDHSRFVYGTWTARMMVPTQAGYWPSAWTLNSNPSGANDRTVVGENDMIEAYTKYSDGYRVASHNYASGVDNGPSTNPLCGGGDIRGQWHDYSVTVSTTGTVTFAFDGVTCWSYTKAALVGKPFGFYPDNRNGNFTILDLAVGNSSQGQSTPTAPAQLLVDSVRVTR